MSKHRTPGIEIANLGNLADQLRRGDGLAVHGASALGLPVHTNGQLGADILRVAAGDHFPTHVHPGDHLLLCLEGEGTITVDQVTYRIGPGDIYMVEGLVPHAVGAITNHILLAIGSPHKPIDSPDRMVRVDWNGDTLPIQDSPDR